MCAYCGSTGELLITDLYARLKYKVKNTFFRYYSADVFKRQILKSELKNKIYTLKKKTKIILQITGVCRRNNLYNINIRPVNNEYNSEMQCISRLHIIL